MKFKVVLNGTTMNPYEQYGLTQNPFPQIAEYGYSGWMLRLQSLAAPFPVGKTPAHHIRDTLQGVSVEFLDGLISRFRPGVVVEIDVVCPD